MRRTGGPPMVDKDEFTKALKLLSQKHIAFVPAYADLMGSVAGGVLLSQLMYHWGNDPGTSFRRTNEQLRAETRLSQREFKEAKRVLHSAPFIEAVPVGTPPVTQYTIDPEELVVALSNLAGGVPNERDDAVPNERDDAVPNERDDAVPNIKKESKKEDKKEREEYIVPTAKKENSVGKERPKPTVSDEAARLAQMLKDSILTNYPNARSATDAQLRQWALELDFLNRIDGKSWEQIEELLAWSQHDPFWKQNIQSGGKFREKWNTLLARASTSGNTFAPPPQAEDKMDVLKRMWLKAKEKENANRRDGDSRDPDALECEFSRVAERVIE